DNCFVLTGDSEGAVKVFTYPAHDFGHAARTYRVHTHGRVNQVAVAHESTTVVSVGRDRAVVQWLLCTQDVAQADEHLGSVGTSDEQASTAETPSRTVPPEALDAEFVRLVNAAAGQ